MSEDHKKDIDDLSGVETTGHEWDGLKELNNPLPRWWLWVFFISIIWSIWYFVVYPAWPVPGGATKGTSGYTQYKELAQSRAQIQARQEAYLEKFTGASFDKILNDEVLYEFAMAGGHAAFKDNCATCHGTGGAGAAGYPNLNDDDWIWGGQIDEIYTTLLHGVRAQNDDTRISQMPAFGKDELLSGEDINHVVEYVMALSNTDKNPMSLPGYQVFQENCASCHGEDGRGDHDFGAPNLTDTIWLYGGDHDSIHHTVYYARAGMMPAWGERLDDNTIRQLAVYVHQLGGGEEKALHIPAETGDVLDKSQPVQDMPEQIQGAVSRVDTDHVEPDSDSLQDNGIKEDIKEENTEQKPVEQQEQH